MQKVSDMAERAEAYLRQEGASTPAKLTALLYAVYNDGVRDMRDKAVKLAVDVQTNASTVRQENQSGLDVQRGRRIAAEAIAGAIGSVSPMKEEQDGR